MADVKIGSVVISKAGHDSDGIFAVVKIEEKYVYICDGKERPVERPKRKNPKHILSTEFILESEEISTNRKLKKALGKYAEAM